jgi:hypothetical protein
MAATAFARALPAATSLAGPTSGSQRAAGHCEAAALGPVHSMRFAGSNAIAPRGTAAGLSSSSFAGTRLPVEQCRRVCSQKAAARSGPRAAEETNDTYTVTLEKPIGLNFYRGNDGGTYIDKIQPGGSADASGLFTVGDKVLETR